VQKEKDGTTIRLSSKTSYQIHWRRI